jgi:phage shock protein E
MQVHESSPSDHPPSGGSMSSRPKLWTLALICAAVLSASSQAADHTKDSLKTVKENVAAEKALLVDVREKSEWEAGHVEDAVFLPLSELRNGITRKSLAEKLPADKIVYTHCVVGVRSRTAADILLKNGYDVRALKPGYKDLIAAGFEKADDSDE